MSSSKESHSVNYFSGAQGSQSSSLDGGSFEGPVEVSLYPPKKWSGKEFQWPEYSSDKANVRDLHNDQEDIVKLHEKYRIPDIFHFYAPRLEDRVTFSLLNHVAMYEEDLCASLRFLLHEFILNVLNFYQVIPTQLPLNFFCILISFILICHFLQMQS